MDDDRKDQQDSAPVGGEDDLLRTIRQMVMEENARAPAPPPTHGPGVPEKSVGAAARAANGGRLVLGAAARVDQGGAVPPAPMFDESALRPIVAEMVREELADLMGEALEHRIRKVVRRELAALLEEEDGLAPGD